MAGAIHVTLNEVNRGVKGGVTSRFLEVLLAAILGEGGGWNNLEHAIILLGLQFFICRMKSN